MVEIGTGMKDFEFTLKVGDRVIVDQYVGMEFVEDGVKYQAVREWDVLATLEE